MSSIDSSRSDRSRSHEREVHKVETPKETPKENNVTTVKAAVERQKLFEADSFTVASANRAPVSLDGAPASAPVAQEPSYPPAVTPEQVEAAKAELPEVTLSRPPIDPNTGSQAVQAPEVVAQNQQVQNALNELGYVADSHRTGYFGSITEGALKSFQYEHGLEVTGAYDAATRDAMAQALAEQREAQAQGISPPAVTPPETYTPITDEQLAAIMPHASAELRERYLEPLNTAMEEFGINTPERQAAFLAQVAVETADLQYMSEIARNPDHGDFYGRGLLQLTHESNYREAGEALGEDLLTDPNVVADDPELAARTAAWYFNDRGLNELADQGRIGRVTLLINGGYNGVDRRLEAYDAALDVMRPSTEALSAS